MKPGKSGKVSIQNALPMVFQYGKKKIGDQLKAVSFIVLYLLLFQLFILRIPIDNALYAALGIGLVVLGLAFFLEGLFLGIMPLGELCGLWLPQKIKTVLFSLFALFLGVVATLAEPAISILQTAGSSIKAWEAPLFFGILNRYSNFLVMAIALGVGIAVLLGMLRFLYSWPLRPLITVLVPLLLAYSAWAYFDPNLRHLYALAWDCGGITTGPVTVPIIVALGLGITRTTGKGTDSGMSGLGVITLASLIPVLAVLTLGVILNSYSPSPSSRERFFSKEMEKEAVKVFRNRDHYLSYAVLHQSPAETLQNQFDGDPEEFLSFLKETYTNPKILRERYPNPELFHSWITDKEIREDLNILLADFDLGFLDAPRTFQVPPGQNSINKLMLALRAIIPLAGSLILVLLLVVKKRFPLFDEILLGLVFSIAGFFLFSLGMDSGLTNLGSQTGKNLHITFSSITFPERSKTYKKFDLSVVYTAYTDTGERYEFFLIKDGDTLKEIPFYRERYNPDSGEYTHIPERGPLLGTENRLSGLAVLLTFAFFLGLAATLAEPSLQALGVTLEEVSAGTFHKGYLIHTVAIGVGLGLIFGFLRIVMDIPLLWLLAPPYLLVTVLNFFSTEEFIGIAWDSAGVTTGPVTVPLVIALGLGMGETLPGVESFGILALASVYPIAAVLISGLFINRAKSRVIKE